MAAAGTLLSDLDGSGTVGGDGDLVQKILSDMSIPSDNGSGAFRGASHPGASLPPALPAQTPQSYNQMPSSTQPMTMDSHIPTSHMIGNQHPTPADFAAAMAGARVDPGAMYAAAPMQGNPMMPMDPMAPKPIPGSAAYDPPSKNIYGSILGEIKIPAVVALLFFVFSLPPIRVLVAHYMPSLIKATGEFHITGLLVISIMVGITFWILQRIIAPLLSL
uniref:Uncharacterized protein n=1 Tax=viral metagenome TaxID=1070528 RepID=A0A6C0KJQ6_9ZZZZ